MMISTDYYILIEEKKERKKGPVVFGDGDTVEPFLTHTPRWSPKCMGYQGLWVRRGMPKIDSKNPKKIPKNTENI